LWFFSTDNVDVGLGLWQFGAQKISDVASKEPEILALFPQLATYQHLALSHNK